MKLSWVVLMICLAVAAWSSAAEEPVPKPGVKEVQVPFASLKAAATFKIGRRADWVLVTGEAAWEQQVIQFAGLFCALPLRP